MTEPKCSHLVAPELMAGIENFPSLDFNLGLDKIREGGLGQQMPPMPPELEAVNCEERHIPGLNGAPDVRLLIYTPPGKASAPRPAVCHIHGGGFVIGTADINDFGNRAMALAVGCVIVSVDYRLAPETRWPGSLEDCYAGLCWMTENAGELGIDAARIAVAGESAGGGHAAALAIYARDQKGPDICFQLLDSPMLDDRTGTDNDPHPHTGEFIWTAERNRFGWEALLGVKPGSADVRSEMVPARTEDLSGLPTTFISIGSLDLFLEENIEYIRRLSRAGVAVELHIVPGAYHGFGAAGLSPQLTQVTDLRHAALARALGC